MVRVVTDTRKLNCPHATNIDFKDMHLLILDQPDNNYMNRFIEECKKNNVHDLVRVCEPTYDKDLLQNEGIRVWHWEFDDGSPPPDSTIDKWLELLRERVQEGPNNCIAVHCKAGLGRAPILVALALIECGMPYDEAIEYIRERRKGALNTKQIQFLKNYRPRRRLKMSKASRRTGDKCAIL